MNRLDMSISERLYIEPAMGAVEYIKGILAVVCLMVFIGGVSVLFYGLAN